MLFTTISSTLLPIVGEVCTTSFMELQGEHSNSETLPAQNHQLFGIIEPIRTPKQPASVGTKADGYSKAECSVGEFQQADLMQQTGMRWEENTKILKKTP